MPKLDGTHVLSRLTKRLEQLKAGEEIAVKEIRSLLTPEQQKELDDSWAEQQKLRKGKRTRTEEEEKQLGWKTKREVRIEVFKKAVQSAWYGIEKEFERLQMEATKRQMRIYMDTTGEALKAGKDKNVAEKLANSALTRAGLNRMDGQRVGHQSKRDREIWEMERQILQKAESEMDDKEREQLELLREHEKAVTENRKKR